MNYIAFLLQAKYLGLMFLICILLFSILNRLISIPGNMKIENVYEDKKVKDEKARYKKLIPKIILITFISILIILLVSNINFER